MGFGDTRGPAALEFVEASAAALAQVEGLALGAVALDQAALDPIYLSLALGLMDLCSGEGLPSKFSDRRIEWIGTPTLPGFSAMLQHPHAQAPRRLAYINRARGFAAKNVDSHPSRLAAHPLCPITDNTDESGEALTTSNV